MKPNPNLGGRNAIEVLRDELHDDLERVNRKIISLAEKSANATDLIPLISDHISSAGGKRLRPMLTLAAAKLCGYEGDAHISLATAVEFIHSATLLHDDVVDSSELRRGVKTANNVWGNKESILVGDFILAKAFSLMGDANSVAVYKLLSQTSEIITEGEVLQLENERNIDLSVSDYDKIITAKTASLFSAACEVSGIISSSSEEVCNSLKIFGLYLGKSFQIIDDVLDYSITNNKIGKNHGDDFKEGKMTLPTILLYQEVTNEEKAIIKKAFNDCSTKNLELVFNLLTKYDSLNKAIAVAENYTKIAKMHLSNFSDTKIRSILIDVLNFVVNRCY